MTNDIVLELVHNREQLSVGSVLVREMVQMEFTSLGRKYYNLDKDACVLAYSLALEQMARDVRLNGLDVHDTDLYQHLLRVGKQQLRAIKSEQIQRQKEFH